ncbi:hypothetical protein [Staphylococcus saprophyticus]|uniref:hypothetical protein n=1 Tax=Staphylococcus saprophyticus TaxID=29385 RepID=UPI001011109B|nr:hypothetical protein [Staphylococcus saprophyticus]RXS18058.1 hypothetical protein EUA46_04150 [Staphylococcus saprophyticus]
MPGKWKIIASTFNMWTSGKKANPSISYSIIEKEPLILLDKVQYQTKYKTKSILGYDKLKDDQFTWTGKGLLRCFSSKWRIIYLDSDILIIQFSSTLVTKAGMDILIKEEDTGKLYKKRLKHQPNSFNLSKDIIQSFQWLI